MISTIPSLYQTGSDTSPTSGIGTVISTLSIAADYGTGVVVGDVLSASYAVTSSFSANGGGASGISSSYSITASYALNGGSGGTSLTTGSTYPITASRSVTSSFTLSASYIGTGTNNYFPKWSSNTLTGTSNIYDDSTNVGIGTSSPTKLLDVNGSSRFRSGIELTNNADNLSNAYWNGSNFVRRTGGYSGDFFMNSSGNWVWYTADSGSTDSIISFGSPKVTITNSGSVGIGTSTPQYQLQVVGAASAGTANSYKAVLTAYTGSPYYGTLLYLSGDSGSNQSAHRIWGRYKGFGSGTALTFERSIDSQSYGGDPTQLNYSESMRISENGYLGIGYTNPQFPLQVVINDTGDNQVIGMVCKNNAQSAYGSSIFRVGRRYDSTSTGSLDTSVTTEYTDIEYNSYGSGPFRFGSNYGDSVISNGLASTSGRFGSIQFVTSGSIRMTIAGGTSAGKIGIGTTSPGANLEVIGNINASTSITSSTQYVSQSLTVGTTVGTPSQSLYVRGLSDTSATYCFDFGSKSNQYFYLRNDGVLFANAFIRFASNAGIYGNTSGAGIQFATGGTTGTGNILIATSGSVISGGSPSGTQRHILLKTSGTGSVGIGLDIPIAGSALTVSGSVWAQGYVGADTFVTASTVTNYTASLSDLSAYMRFNNANPITLWIDTGSNVAYTPNFEFEVEQAGSGKVSISGSGNTTINCLAGKVPRTVGQYGVLAVKRVAQDIWSVYGDVS